MGVLRHVGAVMIVHLLIGSLLRASVYLLVPYYRCTLRCTYRDTRKVSPLLNSSHRGLEPVFSSMLPTTLVCPRSQLSAIILFLFENVHKFIYFSLLRRGNRFG